MYVARYASHKVQEATRSAVRELRYQDVKPEQMKVVDAYVQGRDVFAVLPTGYGKSLCYGCLPIVFDKLTEGREEFDSTPAIMEDQISIVLSSP